MRRSRKETTLQEGTSRLLHNDIHESAGMHTVSIATEAAEEWAAGQPAINHAPQRPPRP